MESPALAAFQRRGLSHLPEGPGAASGLGIVGMSHASPWRCLTCRTPLGEHDAAGCLRPVPPAETLAVVQVEANGAAVLRCATCGAVRLRKPGGGYVARSRQ